MKQFTSKSMVVYLYNTICQRLSLGAGVYSENRGRRRWEKLFDTLLLHKLRLSLCFFVVFRFQCKSLSFRRAPMLAIYHLRRHTSRTKDCWLLLLLLLPSRHRNVAAKYSPIHLSAFSLWSYYSHSLAIMTIYIRMCCDVYYVSYAFSSHRHVGRANA